MFQETFAAELAKRIGSTVEIATDNNVIEGILSNVTPDLVLVLDINDGYGDNSRIHISVSSINFVRLLQEA
ncbi:DUF2642 domain-containing protein [Oceanobacillus sp. Castelsardo]|uniref:DUF2642 domain-containing protein n=1 Tax=Oceanobacillus sp. Castelsardo TaxID=1851204 RepID=UPI0008390528|nr:DUF2642 domain-containing protein [Oceanobacillus sp. Castelsardo]